ncbi:MAG: SCO family protein [Flavobacteriales bacterium]
MKNKFVLFAILVVPSVLYLILTTGKHNIKALPYLGEKKTYEVNENGQIKIDTIYHSIPEFSFTDQTGNTFGSANLENKIYVANFFFTNCPTICKDMQTLMKTIHDRFQNFQDVRLVSFTVDPENDTPEVLNEYAERFNASADKWHFLTGEKEKVYTLASSYLLNASQDSLAPGGFLHSDLVVLIDRKKHIRGVYEGTDATDMKRCIDEIKTLIAEYNIAKKSNVNPVK